MANGTEGVLHGKSHEDQTMRAPDPRALYSHQGHASHLNVCYVQAADAKSAEDIVAKEHRIPDTLRNWLVAIREDWSNRLRSGRREFKLRRAATTSGCAPVLT